MARSSLVWCALVFAACEGSIVGERVVGPVGIDPTTGQPTPTNPRPMEPKPIVTACTAEPTPGSAPMRRLAHEEYRNAIEDLFGNAQLANQVTQGFITDSVSLGFRNGARFLDVKPVMMTKYQEAAETIAAQVTTTANLSRLVPCPTSQGEPCARQAIEQLLTKAYRRPPSTTDVDRYLGVWRAGSMNADFRTGMEWVVGAVLQAPKFLYRVEVDVDGLQARPVGPYELASRLSFFFWESIPDAALLDAARTGRLATAADVEREARRMLADPKAQRLFNFFEQWMDIDELDPLRRDPGTFPGLSTSLATLLREESRQFVKNTVIDGDGSYEALMTSQATFVNGELAQHYGLQGITGTTWQRTTGLAATRGGLFMNSGALITHDKQTRTSIVLRGLRVRTQLMCQTVPAPPMNVPINLGPINTEFSQADRLAEHRTNPSCAGCHTLLDPLGVPFETIDAVGRDRVTESGRTINPSGQVEASRDMDGPVANGLDLMRKLSQSDEARECMVTQLYRFEAGRQEETTDLCSRQRALERFKTSGWNVRELMVALTQTDDFLFKPEVMQ